MNISRNHSDGTVSLSAQGNNGGDDENTNGDVWDVVHLYLMMLISVVGSSCCLMTIFALSRKQIPKTPTHTIITAMAAFNMAAMAAWFMVAVGFVVVRGTRTKVKHI